MSIVVVATFTPTPGHKDDVRAVFERSIPLTHANDEGLLIYAMHESAAGEIVFVEKWVDEASLGAHLNSAATAEVTQQLDGLLAGPPAAVVLTPIPVGDERGAL
jgi:quinol monooxygenase YgiN